MRVLAIVQGRMNSTRLPGKVALDLNGRPLIAQIIRRVMSARRVDAVVLATADTPENAILRPIADAAGVPLFAGQEIDLVDRFEMTVRAHPADAILRVTGDNPMCDPAIIDALIDCYARTGVDFATNNKPPTFPYGLDVEIFSRTALRRLWESTPPGPDRETFTLVFSRPEGGFSITNLRHDRDLSHLRWTVDYPEDLEFARAVYAGLDRIDRIFTMTDVLDLLRREPALGRINSALGPSPAAQREETE
jgi:spore coat polysaccharide biosynthesis protein SpsF (cytidylyltransferase family)